MNDIDWEELEMMTGWRREDLLTSSLYVPEECQGWHTKSKVALVVCTLKGDQIYDPFEHDSDEDKIHRKEIADCLSMNKGRISAILNDEESFEREDLHGPHDFRVVRNESYREMAGSPTVIL